MALGIESCSVLLNVGCQQEGEEKTDTQSGRGGEGKGLCQHNGTLPVRY